MKKILCIVGNRPQFIKHAPIRLELAKLFAVSTLHTGQHIDNLMSDIFFQQLKLSTPDYFLDLPKNLPQGEQTSQILTFIEKILLQQTFDAVLVYGDTNSTLAGVLAAAKLNLSIAHVEAGMRSYNRSMPEEQNRVVADHLATWRFCTDKKDIQILENEGLKENNFLVGDVMFDAFLLAKPFLNRLFDAKYYFVTLHRPYNVDEAKRLSQILYYLNKLDLPVIFALHPRTAKKMMEFKLLQSDFKNIYFIEPQGYIENLSYQWYSEHIITDSGGVQKEAYWLRRPCLTIRSETEWIDTLKNNCNYLIFNNLDNIQNSLHRAVGDFDELLGGYGDTSKQIANIIFLEIMAVTNK